MTDRPQPETKKTWICDRCGMPAKQQIRRFDAQGEYFRCQTCWHRNALPRNPLFVRPPSR